MHLKIVELGDPVPISDVLPMLENFGLRVISERPYELAWPEGGAAWIQDFELEHRDGLGIDIAQHRGELPRSASAPPGAARVENDGFNRLLLRRGPERARRSWCCAPTAATCCRPACPSARPTWSARSPPIRPSPALWCGCSRRASTRRAARKRGSARAPADELDRADPRRARCGREPGRRPHPARLPALVQRHAAHQLLSARRGRRAEALPVLQVRPGDDPGPAAAAADVRDLRLQPAGRGRAPAHGRRGARRHALVGPARGLPHRGPRPDEGAEREEHASSCRSAPRAASSPSACPAATARKCRPR